MRDLLLALIVFAAIPMVFMRPYIGVMLYTWLGLMNPHRLTYGFAYSFPFGTIAAISTIVAMLISSEKKKIPWNSTFVIWLLFVIWMNITTVFALEPEDAIVEWDRTMKIQLMVLVTMLLIQDQKRIHMYVWVVTASIAFFGIKGGFFTVLTGGNYLVMGPWDTFITDNNTLALALIMVLPLMRYLMTTFEGKYIRLGFVGAMGLLGLSILSSHSRGALIASATILLFLIFKSRHRAGLIFVVLLAVPAMLMFMPEHWFDRMSTIRTFEQDASAMGRINAWWFAFNLAKDNFFTGGGFNVFSAELFLTYAPNPTAHHDAHSIYFEVLGEQGFIGLFLFLALGISSLRSCKKVIRAVKGREDLLWANDLAAMLQVSLIGYATGGAFLGLAYYDLYYDLVATVVVLRFYVEKTVLAQDAELAREDDVVDSTRSDRTAVAAKRYQWQRI